MKYLITESQKINILFKYLDSLNLYMVEHNGDYYFWESKKSWENGEYVLIAVHYKYSGFISSKLLVEVSSFFNLGLEDSLDIIGDWVRTKFDFDINKFYSDYGAD